MTNFIFTAMAIASVSLTISKAYIFKPIRNIAWLRKLLSCPYCLAHWLSLFAIIFVVPYNSIIDFTIKMMSLVALSSIMALPVLLYLNLLDEGNKQ